MSIPARPSCSAAAASRDDLGRCPSCMHAESMLLLTTLTYRHLPVALWNDQPYDNQAIYSGSATVVNGTVVLVYPGLCNKQYENGSLNDQCASGRNLATAVPADDADPLLTKWHKRGVIVPDSNGNQSHPYAKPDDGKDPR